MTEHTASEIGELIDELWPNLRGRTPDLLMAELKRRLKRLSIDYEQAKAALLQLRLDRSKGWTDVEHIYGRLADINREREVRSSDAPTPAAEPTDRMDPADPPDSEKLRAWRQSVGAEALADEFGMPEKDHVARNAVAYVLAVCQERRGSTEGAEAWLRTDFEQYGLGSMHWRWKRDWILTRENEVRQKQERTQETRP